VLFFRIHFYPHMRFNLLPLALVAIIVSTANAQKFTPGYYIKLSGDTVRKDLSLKLKKELIEKVVTPEGLFLVPKDLLGFGLNDLNYVVRKVSMDKTPDGGFVTDTVFLEVINRGKISLLYMIDEDDKVHFYIENENGPQELTVRLNDQNDGVVVRKMETYKSALKGIFPTCTELFPAIDKTIFTRKGIQSIYEKLYKCRFKEDAPAMKREENTRSTEFGVYTGAWIENQTFSLKNKSTSQNVSLLPLIPFSKTSISPILGVYLESKFTRKNTLSARHEISYVSYEQTSENWKPTQYASNTINTVLSAKYLRYAFIVRGYFLPKSKVRPFVTAGGMPMIVFAKKHTMTRTSPIDQSSTETPIFNKTSNATVGYFFGAGITYKSFVLEYRYEGQRGFSDELNMRMKASSFMLSYRIKNWNK
jgi:hypothetical protein